jgi:NADPH-dependent curcumin reductase CurA
VVAKNLFIQGFTMVDLVQKYASEFYATVPAQAVKGELKWQEHIYQGIDGVHQAFTDVLTGGNEGKAIVMFATK